MMRSLVSWSLKFRVPVVAIAAVLLVLGFRQLRHMPVDILPEFAPPHVEIQTEALGLSAQEVEQLITLGLEQDLLNGVPWLQSIRSESVPGMSSIVLEFQPGTNLMQARQMTSERLTQAFALPHVSKPPTMLQPMSSTSRVMLIGLSTQSLSMIQMSVLARWTIAPRLLAVPGVANVAIWGQRDRQLQVLVDPKRLGDRHVSLLQVLETTGNALWVSSLSFVEASTPGTGGFIDNANQRLGIRHILPIVSPEGLAQVPIEDSGVRLGDVATVVEGHQPLIGDALTNDNSSLLLVVDRFPGSNLREVTRGVEAALTELRPGLTGLEVNSALFRPADFIDTSIGNLVLAAAIGFALVVLTMAVLFGEWRATVVGAVAIALSLVTGGVVLYLRGVTINVMVLAGFFMAIGIVVDDAIIHVDHIRRHFRAGSTGGAVLEALTELRSPTLFATLIVLLAVSPMFFGGALASAFFKPMALSYGLAVLASMVVALTVTPALSLLLLPGGTAAHRESSIVQRLQQRYESALTRFVGTPRAAWSTLVVALLIGAAVLPVLRRSALPRFAERDLLIHLDNAPGTSQPEMSRISSRVSRELRSVPGVRDVGAHVGRAIFGDQIVNVNSAEVWVSIDPAADYERTIAAVRDVVEGYPGLRPRVQTYLRERTGAVNDNPDGSIVVRVYGDAYAALQNAAQGVRSAMTGIAGISATRLDLPAQEPELEIEVDLVAAQRHGIKPGDVRRAAATMFSGLQVGNLFEEQKVFDVVVWGVPTSRHSINSVRDLIIDSPGGGRVRLGDVARVRLVPTTSTIRHEAVKRYLDVVASVRGRDLGSVATDIRSRLEQVPMPLEYHAEVQGHYADRQAGRQRQLAFALAALVGMFLLLQAAFGSWRLATLSFLTLAGGLVGGMITALVSGGTISLGSLVGFLAVFGIAVRTSTLLIKRFQRLQQHDGKALGTALVLEGTRERFAPMLMTTVATALALLPALLLGGRPGLEVAHPMAVVLLGGLVTTTLLQLFVLPSLYVSLKVSPAADMELGLTGLTESPALSAG